MMINTLEPSMKPFLTVGETRAYLGSSRQFLYNLVGRNQLSIYKVGKRSYFKREDVEGLFQKDQPRLSV